MLDPGAHPSCHPDPGNQVLVGRLIWVQDSSEVGNLCLSCLLSHRHEQLAGCPPGCCFGACPQGPHQLILLGDSPDCYISKETSLREQ